MGLFTSRTNNTLRIAMTVAPEKKYVKEFD